MRSPIEQFFHQTATIHHTDAGVDRDPYGNVLEDTTTTTSPCYLAQNSRTELGLADVERDRWSLALPAGVELDANDAVTIDGKTYQVLGTPWPVVHPATGHVDHIEATVERRA